MAYVIDFNDIIAAGYWFAAAGVVLSILLVARVGIMRGRREREREHDERLRAQWEPVLRGSPHHIEHMGRLRRGDVTLFMTFWNEAHEATCAIQDPVEKAARRGYLDDIASRLSLGREALRLLRSRHVADQFLGAQTCGFLREAAAAPALRGMADSPNPLVSFAAARALLHINHAYADEFVALIAKRPDWSRAQTEEAVKDERAVLTAPLIDTVRTHAPAVARELVLYLQLLEPREALPVTRHLLETLHDVRTIRLALQVLAAIGEPQDATLAAQFAEHQDWRVRLSAVETLEKLKQPTQYDVLKRLAGDSSWWVHYRATQALEEVTVS